MSRIVISDPHGCYKTLMALVAKLPLGVPLTFAGDLIDRGPDSRKVIDFIIDNKHDCVMGNHEQMMCDEVKFVVKQDGTTAASFDPYHSMWLPNGGMATLNNYKSPDGTFDALALKRHVDWMKSLPYYKLYINERDDKGQQLLVSHSTAERVWGVFQPDGATFKNHILWDRKTMPAKIFGIFNVYGHTPQDGGPTVKEHFACIDGGVYFKKYARFGKMYALQFPEMVIYEQENIE